MHDPAAAPDGPCACRTGRRGETSPDTETARGAFALEHRAVHAQEHYTEWRLRCTACGRRYRVIDDQSYWKTLYRWEPLDPA